MRTTSPTAQMTSSAATDLTRKFIDPPMGEYVRPIADKVWRRAASAGAQARHRRKEKSHRQSCAMNENPSATIGGLIGDVRGQHHRSDLAGTPQQIHCRTPFHLFFSKGVRNLTREAN